MRIPHDRTDRPDGALTGHPAALCGLRVVPGYLDREAQEFVLAAVREVIARAPLHTPRMPKSGKPMSVRMTNCGTLGWMTDERGYRYQPTHPETGAPWPPIPGCLLRAWTELGGYPLPPQACLVNVYGVETSFATPIMAGIQALVNQKAVGRQGNPNYRLYALAANQYGASGDSTCNSSNGNAVAMSCIFYDVTLGDIDAVCTGSNNCYTPSGTNGVLSTSNSSYAPAYGATTGWDFATGIGSVNVYNLVMNWNSAGPVPALQVVPPDNMMASGPQGGPFLPPSFSYTLSAASGSVGYAISGIPTWLTASATSGTASSGTTVTFTVNTNAKNLAANTYSATITFTSGTGQSIQRTATLTVTPPALQVTPATGITASGQQGGPFSPTSFAYSLSATGGSLRYSITNLPSWLTVSAASGTVTTRVTSITFRVNTTAADRLAANTYVTSINFNNTTNGQGNTTRVATLNVTPKHYTIAVSAAPSADGTVGGGTFVAGSSQTVTATPSGTHSFVHWTQSGRIVSTSESYTFTLNANVTLVADFK